MRGDDSFEEVVVMSNCGDKKVKNVELNMSVKIFLFIANASVYSYIVHICK